jgi:hypothetical protein
MKAISLAAMWLGMSTTIILIDGSLWFFLIPALIQIYALDVGLMNKSDKNNKTASDKPDEPK